MKQLLTLFSVFFLLQQSNAQETRNPLFWPFSQTSIWNQPIGTNAIYEPANFEDASNVGVDTQHIVIADESFNFYEVIASPEETFAPGRCSGTTSLNFSLPVADDWIVPDAGNSPYGLTPNSNFAIILPNYEDVFQGSVISRCEPEGNIYLPSFYRFSGNRETFSIYSDGLEGGGQGASKMSSLGGTIRLGELVGEAAIRHAIKINPWAAKYCFYSEEIPGWKWPAKAADNLAPTLYQGTDPNIVMGSLFAIPPQTTMEDIGITTAPARKLFYTLKNYGAYFTEDAATDVWDIILERYAEEEFEAFYGFAMSSDLWKDEVNKLMKALHVVINNDENTIGGGGEPLVPLAPPFGEAINTTLSLPNINFNATNANFKLFPNPASSVLNFEIANTQITGGTVEVFTINGQSVWSTVMTASSISINTNNLPAGLYFLRYTKGNKSFETKFIK